MSSKRSIGGYLSLEASETAFSIFNSGGTALNTARNCLELILRHYKFDMVYIPYFTCDVLLEPLRKTNTEFRFYSIDANLIPVFDFKKLNSNDAFLYTNYFGIQGEYIASLAEQDIVGTIIIDNAQALFAKHIEGTISFNSVRKFIGVADGAFLHADNVEGYDELPIDKSYMRMGHLLKRIDYGAEDAYGDFIENDKALSDQPVMRMSLLTQSILNGVDIEKVKSQRIQNFNFLHKQLGAENLLKLDLSACDIPMVYPFRTKNISVRTHLIKHKIYCAQYWPNVLQWCTDQQTEYQLTREIVAIPIDQRYDIDDMQYILNTMNDVQCID